MIKDLFELLPRLKNEAPWILFGVKNYLDNRPSYRTNVPRARVHFFEGDNTTGKRDTTQVETLESRFGGGGGGGVSNHLSRSLITFDRAVVCRDIKVDSVTKLPQYGGLMRAF